jgi:hypothetical protein
MAGNTSPCRQESTTVHEMATQLKGSDVAYLAHVIPPQMAIGAERHGPSPSNDHGGAEVVRLELGVEWRTTKSSVRG